jgi:hypothetical protein
MISKENAKWQIAFELEERQTTCEEEEEDKSGQQREITHVIARAIASIPAQLENLRVTDYRIVRAGKEQPEADTLHTRWGDDRKPR